jgi:glycosyltransferase involved in cell wall biosynthesis
MKIGIDASRAFEKNPTGVGVYSREAIAHLREFLKDEEVVLYVRRGATISFDLPEKWRIREIAWKYFWTQGGLSLEMLVRPVDVLFVPAHTLPIVHPKKSVVVVHGLEYERCPEGYSFLSKMLLRWFTKYSCRVAYKIITVSEATKRDLVSFYNIDEKKIRVIYEGVPFFDSETGNEKPETENTKKPYFLFIGRLETRKNVVRMVEAFDDFRKRSQEMYQLVLAGKPGYGYEQIRQAIDTSPFCEDIIEKGYVSEEEKGELLRNTDALMFFSLAEGFGLPILEAQAMDVPVLCSDIPVFHEIAGKGALFADPRDTKSMMDVMSSITQNEEQMRENVVKWRRENVRRFSWEKCAREIAEVLSQYTYEKKSRYYQRNPKTSEYRHRS